MLLTLLLHLYQPPQQSSYVVDEIIKTSYLPLLKLIKARKDFKVTLNVPLSLLEWFEKQKAEVILEDLKALLEQGRVGLTGTAAYHPILTKIPVEEAERQVILNEAGLAYYFGRREGFEGESALMARDVTGFFPPELAFSPAVGRMLHELGYEWVVVEGNSLACDSEHVNVLAGTSLSLVVRCRDLSLCLAYQRNDDPRPFMEGVEYLSSKGVRSACVALDGETFGHHNREGIELLESIIEEGTKAGHKFELVGDVVREFGGRKEVEAVESTWAASEEQLAMGNLYPRWYLKGNSIHESFERLEKAVFARHLGKIDTASSTQAGNLPVWNFNELAVSEDLTTEQKSLIKAQVSVDRCFNSDKYWWSATKPDYFYPDMIKRSLELFSKAAERIGDEEVLEAVRKEKDVILGILKSEI